MNTNFEGMLIFCPDRGDITLFIVTCIYIPQKVEDSW